MKRSCLLKICLFALALSLTAPAFGADDLNDGFDAAQQANAEYFDLYLAPGIEQQSLNRALNLPASDRILSGRGSSDELTGNIDALFLRVCSILDMRLYNYKGSIKVCRDFNQLRSIYERLFDKDLSGQKSFYVFSNNSIYISADSFKREILGHEIAHAIISHYFVVLPPVKVQEVLACYVEYQLRKGD